MKIVVNEVNGLVQVRTAPDQPWKKADVGHGARPRGPSSRPGPKSACVCTIPHDQTIVLDRLGIVSVAEAIKHRHDDQDRPGDEVRPDRVRDRGGRAQARLDDPQPQQHARRPRHARAASTTSRRSPPSAESYTGRATYLHSPSVNSASARAARRRRQRVGRDRAARVGRRPERGRGPHGQRADADRQRAVPRRGDRLRAEHRHPHRPRRARGTVRRASSCSRCRAC